MSNNQSNPFAEYAEDTETDKVKKEKRYFWLKLKDGFFDDKNIKIIRTLENGYRILCIYLMLQLKALNSDGIIEYTSLLPSFDAEIAAFIGETEETVSEAIKILARCGFVEIVDNDTLFLTAQQEILDYGSEGASAARMRKLRERKKSVT